jgi:hypothetical protein
LKMGTETIPNRKITGHERYAWRPRHSAHQSDVRSERTIPMAPHRYLGGGTMIVLVIYVDTTVKRLSIAWTGRYLR